MKPTKTPPVERIALRPRSSIFPVSKAVVTPAPAPVVQAKPPAPPTPPTPPPAPPRSTSRRARQIARAAPYAESIEDMVTELAPGGEFFHGIHAVIADRLGAPRNIVRAFLGELRKRQHQQQRAAKAQKE